MKKTATAPSIAKTTIAARAMKPVRGAAASAAATPATAVPRAVPQAAPDLVPAGDAEYDSVMTDQDMERLNKIRNILDINEADYPDFYLAKNKARFKKKLIWYKTKKDWLDIAPMQKMTKLFKQQTKELDSIRSHKLDYEMELETSALTPSQRSCRKDELKMCRAHEKMAIQLITKMKVKFKAQSK